MVKYDVSINGLEVNARYSEEDIENIFIPLLKELKELQEKKNKRILVMLAAPPGAGKSTLLSFLENLSKDTEGLKPIQTIGMDGFHRYQDYLLSHTTVRNGKEIKMVEIKGAPETFDLEKLTKQVKMVAAGERCGWPTYDRTLHNPTEDAIFIDGDIVLLEGNYLLLDEEGWRGLSQYADYTISITADRDMLRNRLIERKATSLADHDLEKATAFVDYSDMVNADLCLNKSKKADLMLKVEEDRYIKVTE